MNHGRGLLTRLCRQGHHARRGFDFGRHIDQYPGAVTCSSPSIIVTRTGLYVDGERPRRSRYQGDLLKKYTQQHHHHTTTTTMTMLGRPASGPWQMGSCRASQSLTLGLNAHSTPCEVDFGAAASCFHNRRHPAPSVRPHRFGAVCRDVLTWTWHRWASRQGNSRPYTCAHVHVCLW